MAKLHAKSLMSTSLAKHHTSQLASTQMKLLHAKARKALASTSIPKAPPLPKPIAPRPVAPASITPPRHATTKTGVTGPHKRPVPRPVTPYRTRKGTGRRKR
jgi:hypothetical protein